jgi:hypothetical protein
MGMFLPGNISHRIKMFMSNRLDFPFIAKEEVMAVFYLFGKDYGVGGESEVNTATDLAKTAAEQVRQDIRLYVNMPSKMDAEFIRENYTKRSLQIIVDNGVNGTNQSDIEKRINSDPTILSDCFAQHIAYYKHECFFELFKPFRSDQLPHILESKLKDRMLLLGFGIKNKQRLSFKSSLEPFFKWMMRT